MQPEGYTFLPNGNLLIAERGADRISEFDSDGNYIGRWDNGGTLLGVNFVKAIDFGDLGSNQFSEIEPWVYPTSGSSFNFEQNLKLQYKWLDIYSSSGTLVDSLNPQKVSSWDASRLSEGIYVMVATDIKGHKTSQKIVVKK